MTWGLRLKAYGEARAGADKADQSLAGSRPA